MLRTLHRIFSTNRFVAPAERRVVHWVKDLVYCPDAYWSLAAIHRKVHPVAVLDVGAHTGAMSRKIFDLVPDAKIHAFEPTPASVQKLRQSMADRRNFYVHEIALCDKTGPVSFFINVGDQTSSLLENAAVSDNAFAHCQAHDKQVQVKGMTLDDWASENESTGQLLIKADIQGAEKLLVAGGRNTLAERVPAFYTEVCLLPQYKDQTPFWELHQTLTAELGFVLFDIYPCSKDDLGRAVWTDAMWVKPEILPVRNA